MNTGARLKNRQGGAMAVMAGIGFVLLLERAMQNAPVKPEYLCKRRRA